jgi:hypothetical protein
MVEIMWFGVLRSVLQANYSDCGPDCTKVERERREARREVLDAGAEE